MFLYITAILIFLTRYEVRSQSCSYTFQRLQQNYERNTNNAVHKEAFDNIYSCARYCSSDSTCMAFTSYGSSFNAKTGKLTCVFFDTFGSSTEMSETNLAEYYERTTDSSFSVNSAQYYKDDRSLLVNSDSLVSVYTVSDVSERGISATLQSTVPLETMYEDWTVPPQASFVATINGIATTFLFNGKKYQCYRKYATPYFEKCKETDTYSLFEGTFNSYQRFELTAAVTYYPDNVLVYVLSGDDVYYTKSTSDVMLKSTTYAAVDKFSRTESSSGNLWTNIPSSYTAITMVDASHALVFTGRKYHVYNVDKKVVLSSGYLETSSEECPGCPGCPSASTKTEKEPVVVRKG